MSQDRAPRWRAHRSTVRFDTLTVLSNVEGLTALREIEGMTCPAVSSETENLVGSATAPTTKGEAKEIDNRGRGEYHEPYSFSRLRSV